MNADHRWFEGLEACTRKSKPEAMEIDPYAYLPISDCFSGFLFVFEAITTHTHEQPQRRRLAWYVPNAASSGNLGKSVVAVAAVLGSEIAELLATPSLITRGTRASGPAKHWYSPRQPSADSQTRLNSGNSLMGLV